MIDITKFQNDDASDTEKNLYTKFLQKQQQVFDTITNRLAGDNPPAFKDEDKQMQEYLIYICDNLLGDSLQIISKDAIDTSDATYKAWSKEESISLKAYLTYAASQNWIDISKISPEGEYLDSAEVYQALTAYITDYLKTDNSFSKLLYQYMLHEDTISGQELCLVLYEQGILSKEDDSYEALASGAIGASDFIISKIYTLEIEPAQLALMPCSASAVITDVHTGQVLACVSYPGYDNNRLANHMDTEYYSKLAMDLSSPFFNKATQEKTAPGSTLKPLSTIAGMMEGVIDDDVSFNCTGKFDYVQPPINCWNRAGHGEIGIRTAIEQSCNFFFNMIGFQMGKNGDNEFSETQSLQKLARYATTLANSGTIFDLTLLDSVTDSKGNALEKYEPKIADVVEIPENVWDDLHDGMFRVVQTHSQFDGLGMDVSGKTGTAQIDDYHPDHGLFIGYAPASETEYAVAIRIANGYSSGNACLAANDIFKYIFELADEKSILTGIASSDVSDTSND